MYAVAKGQKNSNGGKVSLPFKHILSQIAFQAKTNDENLVVEIDEIKLFNMKFSGTFTFPASANTAPTNANWAPNDGIGTYTVKKEGAHITVNSTTDATDISKTTPLLVIPQQLRAWNTNTTTAKTKAEADNDKEGYLGISCKIKVNGVDYKIGNENVSGYGYIYVPFGDTWEPGKRYLYTLIFGGGYDKDGKAILIPVNFTADTEEWKDGYNPTNGKEIPLYQQQ